ncbi:MULTISPECIES: exonuclease SbcCD subunit D [Fusobacterium]|uniref:Exonuclease SbcCD subunit D n=1 Tax=Fusobacterium nucleatum TaxID=851 RepID=A0A323TXF3_FUSNU|nr:MULTISPECIES: exonuclease SbcCD subunit D [Fusobacterium]MBS5186423.1 exonuclease SbcCD subunit D [Fusobacterium nucleatum]PCR85508.1 exonuclease SbcD [Fusobacterium nucleatum]PZA05201.1 exonuclease SbcCD subunit D [Fusobacterium nucleatum]QJX51029.1 exonuclease SbcCD subunit D [Fusobacterium nucleatum]HCE32681.1 exonuclease SbcCD subunit D [Fusobacterium sp.]
MKIVHCSDLHLGKRFSGNKDYVKKRYMDFFNAFATFVDKVEEIKPDVCLIAGDIFDKKEINPDILSKTEYLFKRLKDNVKKDLIAIEGNHDNSRILEESWLEYLQEQNILKVFYYNKDFEEKNYLKIDDINFYPVGYPGFMIDEALTKLSEKLNPQEKNIVIVHTGISGGTNTLPGLVSTSILDLFKDKAIYIAGGHIHSFTTYPKEKPYFFVSGSLEFSNVQNEKSDKKGFILFDTDTLNYEFIELEHRKRIKKDFSYSNFSNLENEFENFVKELNLTGEEILVISVSLNNNDYINTENLENIAEKNGALKTHILIKNILNIGADEENNSDLSIDELEKNLINTWNISEIEKFSKSFGRLKELFSNDDRDSFLELFDKTLEVNEDDN